MRCWGHEDEEPAARLSEGRRRRTWELKEAGWKQQDIAAALGMTGGALSQWLKRAREPGVKAAVLSLCAQHMAGAGH